MYRHVNKDFKFFFKELIRYFREVNNTHRFKYFRCNNIHMCVFAVVQMGEEYYNAKDYTKALK